jgi:hypothetical protein
MNSDTAKNLTIQAAFNHSLQRRNNWQRSAVVCIQIIKILSFKNQNVLLKFLKDALVNSVEGRFSGLALNFYRILFDFKKVFPSHRLPHFAFGIGN